QIVALKYRYVRISGTLYETGSPAHTEYSIKRQGIEPCRLCPISDKVCAALQWPSCIINGAAVLVTLCRKHKIIGSILCEGYGRHALCRLSCFLLDDIRCYVLDICDIICRKPVSYIAGYIRP